MFFFLMIRRPPRSTRTEHTLSLHDALPISFTGAWGCDMAEHDAGYKLLFSDSNIIHSLLADFLPQEWQSLLDLDSRSEEHTSELQSLMRISYAVFCLKKKKTNNH